MSEPRTEAGRRMLEWIAFVEKVDDPAGNTIYDEVRRNFLPRIEAEAAQGAAPLSDGSRWSRGGWHWLACWEQWSHDPERECVCDRLQQAATVAACSDHDEDGPTDEASGFPTCSKCAAILSERAAPRAEGLPRRLYQTWQRNMLASTPWDDLPDDVRQAWEAVARTAALMIVPRAEGLDATMTLAHWLCHGPNDDHPGDSTPCMPHSRMAHEFVTRLRPSDERVPESEEPR